MIYQSFKMAVKAIAGNKMRSFLTILGVVIGVVAIVVLVSIGQGANSSVVESIEGMGTNLITANINARRMNPIDLDSLNELAQNEAISYVAPISTVSGTVKAGANTYDDGVVQGTTPAMRASATGPWQRDVSCSRPDIDNRSFVAVIGSEAATEMYGTTHAVGETFSLNGYTITVVGVLAEVGSSASGSNDNQILIPSLWPSACPIRRPSPPSMCRPYPPARWHRRRPWWKATWKRLCQLQYQLLRHAVQRL